MGDLDEALSLSWRRRLDAAELGVNKDEMLWLSNIGTIEDGRRAYTAAEHDYL